jgi:hypothetical protein
VTVSDENGAQTCSSGYVFFKDTFHCYPGPFLNDTHIRDFEADPTCAYIAPGHISESDLNISEQSVCGLSIYHDTTCNYKQGDNTFIIHLPKMQSFWEKKPKCHVLNPLGCSQALLVDGFWNYLGAYYELNHSIEL